MLCVINRTFIKCVSSTQVSSIELNDDIADLVGQCRRGLIGWLFVVWLLVALIVLFGSNTGRYNTFQINT